MTTNKYERMFQIYSWYKTARLNVLYYEESLRRWTRAIQWHDIVIAISGASSPIAFWARSPLPVYRQAWFYLTVFSALSALLKPILRWENRVKLFAELHTHYCDLYMDLKCLCEDIAAANELDSKSNLLFEHYRSTFKTLERKEPPINKKKAGRIQREVNEEININQCWFPPEEGENNAR
jgi:hypothetical protein